MNTNDPVKTDPVIQWMASMGFMKAVAKGYFIKYDRKGSVELVIKNAEAKFFYHQFQSQRNTLLEELEKEGPNTVDDEFIHVSHFVHEAGCIPQLTHHAAVIGYNQAAGEWRSLIQAKKTPL
jgi:hypothetical protein